MNPYRYANLVNFILFVHFFYRCSGYFVELSKPQLGSDNCSNECVKKVALSSNNVGTGRSCSRGCRFFDIAQLIYPGNSTLHGCYSYCDESYKESEIDLISCKTGCNTSKPTIPIDVPLVAEISWSFFIEGEGSEQEDISMEGPFKDQFFEEFKIPNMKFRSVPTRHEGIIRSWSLPHCLLFSLVLLVIILVLLLGLLMEEARDRQKRKDSSHHGAYMNVDMSMAPPLPDKMPILA